MTSTFSRKRNHCVVCDREIVKFVKNKIKYKTQRKIACSRRCGQIYYRISQLVRARLLRDLNDKHNLSNNR